MWTSAGRTSASASSTPGHEPEPIAEHDLVSELYHIIDGEGTLVLGGDLAGLERRPASQKTVRVQNGPGNGAREIRDGVAYDVAPGDILVIPAGTGHQWTKISKNISHLMVRFDPDKIVPVKTEADSRADLLTSGLETPEVAAAEGLKHADLGKEWKPTCIKCPGYFIGLREFQGYVDRALKNPTPSDQQVRTVSIGKAHVAVSAAARHTQTAPGAVEARASEPGLPHHCWPGRAAADDGRGQRRPVGPGDVVVIPAGADYRFLSLQEPITCLAVGVDVTS